MGRGHQRAPEGHVRARPAGRSAYWREQAKAGEPVSGRIVNTTSVSGIYGNPGQTNYGAAKAGIAAFTNIVALEVARYGVTVNAVAPVALTRMTEDLGTAPETDEEREARGAALDRADRHLARLARSRRGSRAACSRRAVSVLAVAEGWVRGPRTTRSTTPTRSARWSSSCWPTPGRTRAWTACPAAGPSPCSNRAQPNRDTKERSTCHSTPTPSASKGEPVEVSWTRRTPALRGRHRRRHRRARLHDREHERCRAAGVPHVPGRDRVGQGLARWATSARSTRPCSCTASRR